MAGPSFFAEVKNVTYGSQAVFGVSNISVQRNRTILKGKNNNDTRYVASHHTFYDETISMDCEDMGAMIALNSQTGAQTLSFNWVASEQNVYTGVLTNQLVTITNVVLEKLDTDAMSKGWGKGKITGTILGVAGGTDPITYANGS